LLLDKGITDKIPSTCPMIM